jgi:transposase
VHQPTFDADTASILFNLPGYRVISATPATGEQPRQVLVETIDAEGACPSCGVLSARVQARPVQHVKDVPCGGEAIDVLVRKRRYACLESACPRRTFTERTDQLPARARVTTRLAAQVITACRVEPRAISRVADEAGLSWPTVMRLLTATVDVHGGQVDTRHVRRLGIDEHRFRRVRYTRGEHGTVTRVEPWSIVFTDLDSGAILDVVDGRRGATVTTWLGQRPRWWRRRVRLVAIDLSSEFRAAIRTALPKAKISADHWHVIRLANEMVTKVRRRRVWETHGRRGRNIDTPYKYRKLLTCAADRLSVRQRNRLNQILEQDIELAVAWGIKEHVRQLLAARDTATFQREWAALEKAVRATRLPEPVALFKTLTAWRRELLTFCRTRVTNARSEAANLTAKTFKRIGRGYRNHDNYRCRIIGYAPRPIAA